MIEIVVPCSCPGKPHEQDTVSIPEVADVRIGTAGSVAWGRTPGIVEDMTAALMAAFLHAAPRAWTFVDAEGEPLPLTAANIDVRLTWAGGGKEVADKAAELYTDDLFHPLVVAMEAEAKKRAKSKASNSGRTADSTSPTPESGDSTDTSAKPSLRAVTGGKRSAARAS